MISARMTEKADSTTKNYQQNSYMPTIINLKIWEDKRSILSSNQNHKMLRNWDFHGRAVLKTLCFQCMGHRSDTVKKFNVTTIELQSQLFTETKKLILKIKWKKKWAKNVNRHSFRKDILIAKKFMKRCPKSLVI